MCFSANVSLLTFAIGIIGSIMCINLGSQMDKMVGYFIGFVSLMQGVEYLLWRHQKCDLYNNTISMIGMILNHLQPIVLAIVILYFNTKLASINKNIIILIILLYTLIIIPYSIQYFYHPNYQCVLKGTTNPHLIWKWNKMKYSQVVYTIFFIVFCSLFLLGLPTLNNGLFACFLAIFTYGTSAIIYPQGPVGALWCFYVIFIPILYYLFKVLTKKYKFYSYNNI